MPTVLKHGTAVSRHAKPQAPSSKFVQ